MDDFGGSEAFDLSLEDLMDEYSSLPPQIAEWLWCIEYVAKFVKEIRCILGNSDPKPPLTVLCILRAGVD